ncbi:MAG TPA: antitoxin [Dehalococcoidia bacterium]|jgi:predicted transcriptional regulator
MRTTIDLPEDLHNLARDIARDKSWTLSQAVEFLMRRGLLEERPVRHFERSPVTGLPVIHAGRVITSEDVKALEDDE